MLTTRRCLGEVIMSFLTAIFQAILQAIAWIFPISESGHSSIFHDFAGRTSGSCSALTGVIHIGIAVGIFLALFKLFLIMLKNLAGTFADLFKKQIKGSSRSSSRYFMYMSLISFVPMLLWLIPTNKGLLYTLFRTTGFNATLLDDGIFLIALGVLVIMSAKMLEIGKNDKRVTLLPAIVTGVFSVLLVPLSGLSLIAGVFAILMLFGVSKKEAFRYSFVMSFPVLLVMGIIEICTATVSVGFVQAILALLISAGVSFLCVRVLKLVINTAKLKYFGFYDVAIGVIAGIVGIFELILK